MPFPKEPLPQVPLVAGEIVGAGGVGVGAGVAVVQYAEPIPQCPHFEQQRPGLEQIPFPTEPLPQVPPVFGTRVGEGSVGEAVGAGVGGIGAAVGAGRAGEGVGDAANVGFGVVG
jgi:hypothetical protein